MPDAFGEDGHGADLGWVGRDMVLLDESATPCGGRFEGGVHAFDAKQFPSGSDEQSVNAVGFEDVGGRKVVERDGSEGVGFQVVLHVAILTRH